MKKQNNRFIVGLYNDNAEYKIGNVTYIVSSQFQAPDTALTIKDRIESSIKSEFVPLTVKTDQSIMADGNICMDCCTSYDVRKED